MDDTTERELLTWAAKAAGYEAIRPSTFSGDIYLVLSEGEWQPWNPHTEDGDALRLAVQCGMEVSFVDDEPDREGRYVRACAGYALAGDPRMRYVFEDHRGDIFAATRRAVVRAAAAIGKAMP